MKTLDEAMAKLRAELGDRTIVLDERRNFYVFTKFEGHVPRVKTTFDATVYDCRSVNPIFTLCCELTIDALVEKVIERVREYESKISPMVTCDCGARFPVCEAMSHQCPVKEANDE